MAKNKGKNKNKNKQNTSKDLQEVGADLTGAIGTGTGLGLFKDSEKLGTSDLEVLLDPTSGAYIGGRSGEDKDTLEALERNVQKAGDRSAEMSSLLSLFKDGLAGLNATENQALRETAQREVNREYETGLSELKKAQARNRTRGGAAARQTMDANRNRLNTQSEMEQDLLVKNIDIQDKRRKDYGDVLTTAERDEFGRTQDALNAYTDASGKIQDREFGRVFDTRNQFLDSKKFNIDMAGKDQASKVAGATGLLGLAYTNRNNRNQLKLAKQGMKQSSRNSSSSNSGGNSQQQLLEELTRLGNEHYGE